MMMEDKEEFVPEDSVPLPMDGNGHVTLNNIFYNTKIHI